ncbi:hypothetical protein SLT36_30105 (plasmid) [Aminobacter sp. BA135]|uniref:hypothetical protein n=1 Tax=Aminobacter sp. BA135 TaxID=537596 RepID=UPI003D79CC6F
MDDIGLYGCFGSPMMPTLIAWGATLIGAGLIAWSVFRGRQVCLTTAIEVTSFFDEMSFAQVGRSDANAWTECLSRLSPSPPWAPAAFAYGEPSSSSAVDLP